MSDQDLQHRNNHNIKDSITTPHIPVSVRQFSSRRQVSASRKERTTLLRPGALCAHQYRLLRYHALPLCLWLPAITQQRQPFFRKQPPANTAQWLELDLSRIVETPSLY